MGDRALIIVTDGRRAEVSPTIYRHWGGESVPELLKECWSHMKGRRGDVSYCAARMIGLAHECTPGNASLGVFQTPDNVVDAVRSGSAGVLKNYSHGDAGVVLYDCDTGAYSVYGGYLKSGTVKED